MAGKKLFVGRLPFDFTDEKLRELFAREGNVAAAIMVPDPKHGRSRGFGFVTMASDAETETVIRQLNGTRIGEKEIWVTEAKEKEVKPPPFVLPATGGLSGQPQPPRGVGAPPKTPRFEGSPHPRRDFPPRDKRPFSGGPRGDAPPPRRPNRFGPRSAGRFSSSQPQRFGERPAGASSSPRPSRFGTRPAGGFSAPRTPRFGARPAGGFSSPHSPRFGDRPSSGRKPSRPGSRPPPRPGNRNPSRPSGSRPRRDPR